MGRLGPLLTSKASVFEASVCQVLRVWLRLVRSHVQSVVPTVWNRRFSKIIERIPRIIRVFTNFQKHRFAKS